MLYFKGSGREEGATEGLACTEMAQGQPINSRRLDRFSKSTFPKYLPLFVQKRVIAREVDERGRGPEDDNLE